MKQPDPRVPSKSQSRLVQSDPRNLQRDAWIGLLDRKSFEAHPFYHHPSSNTITPYNSSDAGVTATTAAVAAAAAAHSESA